MAHQERGSVDLRMDRGLTAVEGVANGRIVHSGERHLHAAVRYQGVVGADVVVMLGEVVTLLFI